MALVPPSQSALPQLTVDIMVLPRWCRPPRPQFTVWTTGLVPLYQSALSRPTVDLMVLLRDYQQLPPRLTADPMVLPP